MPGEGTRERRLMIDPLDIIQCDYYLHIAFCRHASMPAFIEEMHKNLVDNLNGEHAPYSLETVLSKIENEYRNIETIQLLTVSDLIFPHCALFFATTIITQMTVGFYI